MQETAKDSDNRDEKLERAPRDPVSQAETARMIADTLGETEFGPRASIGRIVQIIGRTQARELLAKTQEIEANGGMMLPDGSRRRTPGGVFFHLVYTIGKPKPGKTLERPQDHTRKPKSGNAQSSQTNGTPQAQKATETAQQQNSIFSWDDRIAIVNEASKEKGTATTMKMTLIGRPGKVIDKGAFVMTIMESSKIPMLPKGLPTPSDVTTKYTVYIASKQWKKVSEAIQDPEDALIIEGFPKLDAETSAIAVFASNITTKKQQMAKKQPQPAAQ